ncbi:MAG: hypothetical protein ACOZBX_06725, partial [Campylobacterota bacterium]
AKYAGATLIQGFWTARPTPDPVCENFPLKIDAIKTRCDRLQNDRDAHTESLGEQARSLCTRFCQTFCGPETPEGWHEALLPALSGMSNIEALYLINASARQVGPTLLRGKTRSFFEPAEHGSDHSRKEYFIRALDSKNGYHLTANYVSLATGNLCCTYAAKIEIASVPYVLCIDFIR